MASTTAEDPWNCGRLSIGVLAGVGDSDTAASEGADVMLSVSTTAATPPRARVSFMMDPPYKLCRQFITRRACSSQGPSGWSRVGCPRTGTGPGSSGAARVSAREVCGGGGGQLLGPREPAVPVPREHDRLALVEAV